mmetsp:Transcript_37807/g.84556  ORF Transcript_37807/g.84556 Transcript_37807/m.84556 type:complete len:283 (-) Transcript_37807:652-1500(-)
MAAAPLESFRVPLPFALTPSFVVQDLLLRCGARETRGTPASEVELRRAQGKPAHSHLELLPSGRLLAPLDKAQHALEPPAGTWRGAATAGLVFKIAGDQSGVPWPPPGVLRVGIRRPVASPPLFTQDGEKSDYPLPLHPLHRLRRRLVGTDFPNPRSQLAGLKTPLRRRAMLRVPWWQQPKANRVSPPVLGVLNHVHSGSNHLNAPGNHPTHRGINHVGEVPREQIDALAVRLCGYQRHSPEHPSLQSIHKRPQPLHYPSTALLHRHQPHPIPLAQKKTADP